MKHALKSFKSENGFVSSFFVIILNVVLLLGFIYAFINFHITQKDYQRKICLIEFKEIQTSIVKSEESIFRLNSLSSLLRLRMTQLKMALAAAIAVSNYPVVAQINLQIAETYQKQVSLDQLQRSLMLRSQFQILQRISNLNQKIQSQLRKQTPVWNLLLYQSTSFSLKPIYSLPIQPDSIGGIAPNYELKPNYKQLQMLALNWNQSIQTKLGIKSSSKDYSQCSLTAKKEGSFWTIEINPDKS